MLHRRGRIAIDRDTLAWFHDLSTSRGLLVLPITVDIAVRAAELQEILRDPIDCLIAATALTHDAALVTKDDRIRRSNIVATIW